MNKQALVPVLGPSEARRLTDAIKRDAEALWQKLVELYDGGAHTALGYSSWQTYCEAEFGFGRSQSYRLLEAGRVAELVPHGGMNERQARELAPLLRDEDENAVVEVWSKVSSGVIKQGFAIEYRDLEPPRTGIFDGLRIVIDPDVGFEMQCFLLLHLFGHSVQWVAPSLEHKLGDLQNTQDRARFMQVLHAYELEAACFGMQLLHSVGVATLDEWYSDFVATDWRYVERYYETDSLPDWKTCVVSGAPLVTPAPIPELRLHQVQVRFAF